MADIRCSSLQTVSILLAVCVNHALCQTTTPADDGGSNSVVIWGIVGGVIALCVVFVVAIIILCINLKVQERRHRKRRAARRSASEQLLTRRTSSLPSTLSMDTEASGFTATTSLASALSSPDKSPEVLFETAQKFHPPAPNIVVTFQKSPRTPKGKAKESSKKDGDNRISEQDSQGLQMVWTAPPLSALDEASRESSRVSTLQKSSAANSLDKGVVSTVHADDIPEVTPGLEEAATSPLVSDANINSTAPETQTVVEPEEEIVPQFADGVTNGLPEQAESISTVEVVPRTTKPETVEPEEVEATAANMEIAETEPMIADAKTDEHAENLDSLELGASQTPSESSRTPVVSRKEEADTVDEADTVGEADIQTDVGQEAETASAVASEQEEDSNDTLDSLDELEMALDNEIDGSQSDLDENESGDTSADTHDQLVDPNTLTPAVKEHGSDVINTEQQQLALPASGEQDVMENDSVSTENEQTRTEVSAEAVLSEDARTPTITLGAQESSYNGYEYSGGGEEAGVSLGLDVELWGAADEQQPVQQDDIWDAIHGFYDESANALTVSPMPVGDRSNVEEDLEQLNMSIDTLDELRRLEAKERKAAKSNKRHSQPLLITRDKPSIHDIFPETAPTDGEATPGTETEDEILIETRARHHSSPAYVAPPVYSNSLSHVVDNAEKEFLEAPVFKSPGTEETVEVGDGQGVANSLFVNPMYTPMEQT